MSTSCGETSPASQKTATPNGPETSKRTSADASHWVNPPMGTRHVSGSGVPEFGLHSIAICAEAVCGFKKGTNPWGAMPRKGKPRFDDGPPEKKPRKYRISTSRSSPPEFAPGVSERLYRT